MKYEPKTTKGVISLIHKIANCEVCCLNDYDKLSKKEKKGLKDIRGFVNNVLGDELEQYDKRQ